jgi:hypothetical protein
MTSNATAIVKHAARTRAPLGLLLLVLPRLLLLTGARCGALADA